MYLIRHVKESVGVVVVIGTLVAIPHSVSAYGMSGMYPMTGMPGMATNYGQPQYPYPIYGMPWMETMPMGGMYISSGMYPMYGDPRYMARSPQLGMPWMEDMRPVPGKFGMLPMSGGMAVMPPVTPGVSRQYPMYGMPWNLYNRQGTGAPIPMYILSGMYPMPGYNYRQAYPSYGMPWVEGMLPGMTGRYRSQ